MVVVDLVMRRRRSGKRMSCCRYARESVRLCFAHVVSIAEIQLHQPINYALQWLTAADQNQSLVRLLQDGKLGCVNLKIQSLENWIESYTKNILAVCSVFLVDRSFWLLLDGFVRLIRFWLSSDYKILNWDDIYFWDKCKISH